LTYSPPSKFIDPGSPTRGLICAHLRDSQEVVAMRRLLLAALIPWFLASTAAAQPADVRALIERAISAQGGRDNLTRAKAGYRKSKGIFYSDNFKFTGDSFGDGNDRAKITLQGDDNNPLVLVMVL